MMISADRWVVAGEQGPFANTLEGLSRHFERIDVIGRRPEQRVHERVFGNVWLHHPHSGKLRTSAYVRRRGIELAGERPYGLITSQDDSPFLHALGAYGIWRRTGIPVLSELHHVRGYPRAASARERFDLWFTRRYVAWARRWVRGFRVVNAGEMPALLEAAGAPREQIHVLPSLYIDLDTFRPDPAAPLDTDITLCARMSSNKGVFELLEAARRMVTGGRRDLSVHLIGRGELERAVDAAIARMGLARNVRRTAWLSAPSELADVLRRSRVVVCASYSEGGPRVVAEALACGTPVISTRVGVAPELIEPGAFGWLYDGSPEELTGRLRQVLEDPALRTHMSRQLVERAPIARFERRAALAALAEGFRRIARQAPAR